MMTREPVAKDHSSSRRCGSLAIQKPKSLQSDDDSRPASLVHDLPRLEVDRPLAMVVLKGAEADRVGTAASPPCPTAGEAC